MADRFVVRRTDYGYGIWDTEIDDWWIPRLEMTGMDAQRLAAELNASADSGNSRETGETPETGESHEPDE